MKKQHSFDIFEPILRRLRQHNAIDSLETLIAHGADRDVLLSHLLLMNEIPRVAAFEGAHGLTRKQVQRVIRSLKQMATKLERLNRVLPIPESAPPIALTYHANALEKYLVKWDTPPSTRTSYLSFLVWHVKSRTGKYHDAAVSSLIAAALNKSCDTTAHAVWRRRNRPFIRAFASAPTPSPTKHSKTK